MIREQRVSKPILFIYVFIRLVILTYRKQCDRFIRNLKFVPGLRLPRFFEGGDGRARISTL